MNSARLFSWVLVWLMLLSACATFSSKPSMNVSHRNENCTKFFQSLSDVIDQNGVRDASSTTIDGFPYLRTSRFLQAIGEKTAEKTRYFDWVMLMKNQAYTSFEKEIQNLPNPAVENLACEFSLPKTRSAISDQVIYCGEELLQADQNQLNFHNTLASVGEVPAEYSRTLRIFGGYPLTAPLVAYLTHRVQKKFKGWFELPLEDLPITGRLAAFVPESTVSPSPVDLKQFFTSIPRNALQIPILNNEHIRKLARRLAPIFFQDVSASYDVPGKVSWKNGRVSIDTGTPAVYYYISYALIQEQPIVQMNYVVWFEARKGPLAPRIERGPIDGLTVRISIDDSGSPLMIDMMNNCGCYHLFIPKQKDLSGKKEKALSVDAFIPQSMPEDFPDLPLHIRVNSGWHQVQRVWTSSDQPQIEKRTYSLIPYEELEMLSHENGQRESVFSDQGIMKGSSRIEPVLLFSMGVPSVGSMRQRGHHAITLVGWNHFDDPYLLEKNFCFDCSSGGPNP